MRLKRLGTAGATRVDFLDLREMPGVSVPDQEAPLLALAPPVPNPAAGSVEVLFSLPAPGHASLAVYDLSGRRVNTLLTGLTPAGPYRLRWYATDERGSRVPAGMYYFRLVAAGKTLVRNVVIVP